MMFSMIGDGESRKALRRACNASNGRARDARLWRRFEKLEKLPPAERKPIIQVLDAFLAKARAD